MEISTCSWLRVKPRLAPSTGPRTVSTVAMVRLLQGDILRGGGGGRGEAEALFGAVQACPAGELGADEGDEVAAVGDGVFERVETADEERGGAGVDVGEERFGDLVGGADDGGGVTAAADRA